MKRFIIFLIIFLLGTLNTSALGTSTVNTTDNGINTTSNCEYSSDDSISKLLFKCKPNNMVTTTEKLNLEGGVKNLINKFIKNIMIFLGLMAILAIVYGGFSMVVSVGDDEKIKKAKDIVKWAILGFVAMIIAGGLVGLVVNFIYSL